MSLRQNSIAKIIPADRECSAQMLRVRDDLLAIYERLKLCESALKRPNSSPRKQIDALVKSLSEDVKEIHDLWPELSPVSQEILDGLFYQVRRAVMLALEKLAQKPVNLDQTSHH